MHNIKVVNLTKFYGRTRGVVDLNLCVKKGEIFGFLGPNGAGKTTAIRLFLGLLKPKRGGISLLGHNIKKERRQLLQKIGYLPEEMGLYYDLTGKEFLDHLMALRKGLDKTELMKRRDDLMARFKIDFQRKIKKYSRGMKQIIGIIQAFMHDPELLILDEPTSSLDPLMQDEFYKLLKEEKDKNKTIFLSSHNLGEVERICDRVGVIKEGKMRVVEDVEQLRLLIGKKITIVLKNNVPLLGLEKLPGIEYFRHENGKIRFFYKGDLDKLILGLSKIGIKDFICEFPSLEDIFFKYYKG